MKLLENTRWKTVRAQWKHRKRTVPASRNLRQKARLRKESGLYFYHRTPPYIHIAIRIKQLGVLFMRRARKYLTLFRKRCGLKIRIQI